MVEETEQIQREAERDESSSAPPAPLSGLAKAWIAGALAFELTAGIVGGGLSGYFLDQWLHTQPFLTIILLLVGSVGGMVLLIRGLQRLER
jgi:F0F1-type ATP synthase assembly protein I